MSKRRDPKFYQTEAFKELYEKWVIGKKKKVFEDGKTKTKIIPSKLHKTGFKDVENVHGRIKDKDTRSNRFKDQQEIARISSALFSYVENKQVKLKSTERIILRLYSQGISQKKIGLTVKKSRWPVWRCLKKHIPVALGLYSLDEAFQKLEEI